MLKFMLGVAVGFGAAVLLLKKEFDMRVEDIRIEELEKRSKDAMKVKDEAEKAVKKYSGETEENEDIVYEIKAYILGEDGYDVVEVVYDEKSKTFSTEDDPDFDADEKLRYFASKFRSGELSDETFIRNDNNMTDYDVIVSEIYEEE